MTQPLRLGRAMERFIPAIVSTEWMRGSLDVVFVDPSRIDTSHLSLLYDLGRVHKFDIELVHGQPTSPLREQLANLPGR